MRGLHSLNTIDEETGVSGPSESPRKARGVSVVTPWTRDLLSRRNVWNRQLDKGRLHNSTIDQTSDLLF
jgi:hypothetical protein